MDLELRFYLMTFFTMVAGMSMVTTASAKTEAVKFNDDQLGSQCLTNR